MRIERWLYTIPLRLRSIFRRSAVERELDEELRYHIDQQVAELTARGTPPDDARRIALARFGGIERRKDEVRDTRRVSLLEHLVQDVRYSLRMLHRSPVFAAVTGLSLALGIGATTSVFGVIDALALRRLPVAQPERLVTLREIPAPSRTNDELPYEEYTRLRNESGVFSGMAAMNIYDRSNIAISGQGGGVDAGRARVAIVTGDYFDVLGATARTGRTLTMADDVRLGDHPVAVISDGYRQRRLGNATNVVGRQLTMNGTVFTIVGVTQPAFTGHWVERPADIWVPFAMHQQVIVELPYALIRRNDSWLHLVGRLVPGVSMGRAGAATQHVYQRIMRDWAGPNEPLDAVTLGHRVVLLSAEHGYSPRREALTTPLRALVMVVLLVLAIACANVAALLLARGAARERELAVRLALGAGRGRVMRQLLTESTVLAAIGGLLGVVVALWGTFVLSSGMTAGPVEMFWGRSSWLSVDAHVNERALLVTGAVCLTVGLLFGLAPARRGSSVGLSHSLTGRGASTNDRRRFRLGKLLVVVQVSLSIVVVVAAALFAQTVRNLDDRNLGYDRAHVLLAWTQPSATGASPAELREVWHRVVDRVSAVPGVVAASASNGALLNGVLPTAGRPNNLMTVAGQAPKPTTRRAGRTFIAPRYFEALGVRLVAGREFSERDTDAAPRTAILSEALARHYFGEENPVGRIVAFPPDTAPNATIIGVAPDVIEGTPREVGPPPMRTYFSYRDRDSERRIAVMMVVVRTVGDPRAMVPRVQRQIQAAAPNLPVLGVNTVDDRLADVLAQDRLIASLALVFAGLAVLLACLGLYGVIAYTTTRRTNEIGVRVALGASRTGILRMILSEGLALTLTGIVVGVPVALIGSRSVADRLFGVSATDLPTIVAASLGMIAVASAASFIPARRAASVDPVVSLRQ